MRFCAATNAAYSKAAFDDIGGGKLLAWVIPGNDK